MKVSQNPNYLNVKNAFWFENKIKKISNFEYFLTHLNLCKRNFQL